MHLEFAELQELQELQDLTELTGQPAFTVPQESPDLQAVQALLEIEGPAGRPEVKAQRAALA